MKISVCVPCYNVEKYLNNLFDCLDKQTFNDYEVIFVDDGSTDNTFNIIKKYISNKDNTRFKLFKQKNVGLAETRNVLISKSSGDYIFFLDSDDTIPENTLEVLWKNSNNGQNDIVVGRAQVIINRKRRLPFIVQYRYVKKMTNIHYVKSNLCTCWGAIIKRELFDVEKFLKGYSYEDIGLINYIYLKSKYFKSIKDITYLYWRRKDSLSNFSLKNKWKIIDIYMQAQNTLRIYKENDMLSNKLYRRAINGTLFQILIATNWLSKFYSNNNVINKLPMFAIDNLISEYGLKLKFSKTFWKSLAFFYTKNSYRNIKFIYERITKKEKHLKINKLNSIKNNKKLIYLDDGTLTDDIASKFNKASFLSTNTKLKSNNVLIGYKPNKISKDILDEEKIFFIDITSIEKISEEDINILKNINKRIMILSNTKIFDSENVIIIKKSQDI